MITLVVLDGWGERAERSGNAIREANTPNFDRLAKTFPKTSLFAAGSYVGLPVGEAGNTECGHINLGAGRVVLQDAERINRDLASNGFGKNREFLRAFAHAKRHRSSLHLLGLIGSAQVHASLTHILALIQLAVQKRVKRVFLHIFTDGRDSSPYAAKLLVARLERILSKHTNIKIASIMGRFWAMDRDRRWERTMAAYRALTEGKGQLVKSTSEAIAMSYLEGVTDEFIKPSLICEGDSPVGLIRDSDAVIFANFRVDRPRQLVYSFLSPIFKPNEVAFEFDEAGTGASSLPSERKTGEKRDVFLKNLYFLTMTEYSKEFSKFGARVAYPPFVVSPTLSFVISEAGFSQLKIAESEKERFVTYYFNGIREEPFKNEERQIVPSPRVKTYDLAPKMSAEKITNIFLTKLKSKRYAFTLINFANSDMLGHTGNLGAAVNGIETVDACLGKIANAVLAQNGSLVITADHGNAEQMITPDGRDIDTEHNANKVPLIVVDKRYKGRKFKKISAPLAWVAPTVLSLMGIAIPKDMTGENLLKYII